MKNLLLIILLFCVSSSLCHAQDPEFYGMTYHGGKGGVGSIFQTDGTGASFKSDFSFYSQSANPMGNVIQASNGLLYGMTSGGGLYGGGTIFSYDTSTNIYIDVYDFGNGTDGRIPLGSLIQGSDGLLYGMTSRGGTFVNYGIIFSYNISTGKETVLHNFAYGATDAATPNGSLVQVNDSMLYGMAKFGGPHTFGIIFSYNIHTGVETDVHNFGSDEIVDGNSPLGSLILAKNGLLYGLAQQGGAHDAGMMFSFNPADDSEIDIHDFTGADGANPLGSLIQGNTGLLYGMTSTGGANLSGTIFSYNISKDTLITLHNFGSGTDGEEPNGSLIEENDSMLYGMTSVGGPGLGGGNGIIFSYNIIEGTEIILHDFKGTDGKGPIASLLQTTKGLLYGMTPSGGSFDAGVLFKYNISTDTEMVLHNFGIDTDGNSPNASLIKANNRLIYGLTQNGGINNDGSIFIYNMSANIETDLYDFGNGTDGQMPYGSLLQVNDNMLYGLTSAGGVNGVGIIFSYNILTKTEKDIYDFKNSTTDGQNPYGSLIMATNGLLYGMTNVGGANGAGIIFSYSVSENKETNVYDFGSGSDGEYPYGSLIQASDSLLYGMTDIGGAKSEGTIFSYNISTGIETVLHNFGGVLNGDGSGPNGSLFQANNGLLYGMTYGGGSQDLGSIFSYDITTSIEKLLVSFNGTDGQNPAGAFVQSSNGLLYGLTSNGGPDNNGVIFSFDISSGKETDIHNFTGIDGDNPNGNLLEVDTFTAGINQLSVINNQLSIYPNPTSGQFTIKLNVNQNGYTLEIYNVMGEKIYQSANKSPLGDLGVINLNSQPAGLYFVYLKSDKGVEVGKVLMTK